MVVTGELLGAAFERDEVPESLAKAKYSQWPQRRGAASPSPLLAPEQNRGQTLPAAMFRKRSKFPGLFLPTVSDPSGSILIGERPNLNFECGLGTNRPSARSRASWLGQLQNAYGIGDLGRTYPGDDHRDDCCL